MQASSTTRSDMFQLIEDWKQSGLSQQAFCREKNLRYHQFHYWYKVYRDGNSNPNKDKPAFVPVHLKEVSSARPSMELLHTGGSRIVFYHQPSADFLKALL